MKRMVIVIIFRIVCLKNRINYFGVSTLLLFLSFSVFPTTVVRPCMIKVVNNINNGEIFPNKSFYFFHFEFKKYLY